jgi:hypothetical protein
MRKGNLQAFGFSLLLVFVLFSLARGTTLVSKKENTLSIEAQFAKNDFEHYQKLSALSNFYFVYEGESTEKKMTTDVYGFKGKSVKRAFLYSLVIPGTGEFYAHSKIKAFLFFGADVACWSLYFSYHKKGKNKENQYKAFADSCWEEVRYSDWWDELDSTARKNYSHTLPDGHNQQYYEMIGKYNQFAFAWKDFIDSATAGPKLMTPYRSHYLDLRAQSNNLLDKAKYSAMFSLANHILSAFDAAIAVRKHNKKGERFSQIYFQMRLSERDEEVVPKLSMSMRF